MPVTSKNTLKNWFKQGLKPLEVQFAAWIDAYWHKDESIPMSSVEGLVDALNSVPSEGEIEALNTGKEDKINKGVANGYASLGPDGLVPAEQLPEMSGGTQNLSEVLLEGNNGGGLQIKNIADPTLAQDADTLAARDAAVAAAITALKGGVPSPGDTLNKLYNLIVSLGELVGPWNTASLPTTGSGASSAIDKGDYWRITGTITIAGIGDLKAGDMLIASVNNASVAADFFAVQNNVDVATSSVFGIIKLYTDLAASNTDGSVSQAALVTALGLKAALASPAFTGTPTAPTASLGTNTNQVATMAALLAALGAGVVDLGNLSGAVSIDLSLGRKFKCVLTGSITSLTFTNEIVGLGYLIDVTRSSNHSITLAAGKYRVPVGVATSNVLAMTDPTANGLGTTVDKLSFECAVAGRLDIVITNDLQSN